MVAFQDNQIAGWTVLIIDDEYVNVTIAERMLRFYGATVHVARDGIQGLRLLKTIEQPTFVLLDLEMPNLNGWQTIKHIRKQHPDLPVFATTAYSHDEVASKALNAGFTGYISKPFIFKEFFQEIKDQLAELVAA